MAQYPFVIELSALDGTNGFQINGEFSGREIGHAVAGAGDVNGDGFDDLIIGAQAYKYYDRYYNRHLYGGPPYVIFGSGSGFPSNLDVSTLDGSDGFQIGGSGYQANTYLGFSVAGAGDVNGDGFADFIVGDPYASPHGIRTGASYVVFGKASGFSPEVGLSALDGADGLEIYGGGHSVAGAGDVNGDGFDDVIIGGTNVLFGKASGFPAHIELSALDGSNGFHINGGSEVASAGDVNGDGFADVIIGAPFANPNGDRSGESYVVFGQASGFAPTIELSALDGSDGFQINGEASGDQSGFSAASAGDVNADGFDDVIIGAYGARPHGKFSGATYVVFGKASGFSSELELSDLDGADGFQINGEAADDRSGHSVASAGDVNGDGFADLIISAPDRGASYVVFGKAGGFASNIELSALDGPNGFLISGEGAWSYSGRSVAGAGDINGDGIDDLIIGAPHAGRGGASYVVYGKEPGEAVARDGTAIANRINGGEYADTLAGLGGDDTLIGHGGADSLDGGDGSDTADYSGSANGVTVNLLTSSGSSGDAAGDTLTSIENVIGSAADDSLTGDDVRNHLTGNDGNDTLYGYGEDDTLVGGAGSDDLHGGAGNDTADYSTSAAGVTADLAAHSGIGGDAEGDALFGIENLAGSPDGDHLAGNGASNQLIGNDGNDTLIGREGDDRLFGGRGNDSLSGGAHNDSVHGGGGSDVLIGGGGADHLDGGGGRDTASYLASSVGVSINLATGSGSSGDAAGDTLVRIETLIGSHHADTLQGDANANLLNGGQGADTLSGGEGNDTLNGAVDTDLLRGGGGDDTLHGGDGGDTLNGGSGADQLNGGAGHDYLNGGGGNDTLRGGIGNDTLNGDAGNDMLVGHDGADSLNGGDGRDTADYSRSVSGVTVNLLTGSGSGGDAAGDTLTSIENIIGSRHADTFLGDANANLMNGGRGDDTLNAGGGDDTLYGGDEGDTLNGGSGTDHLHGGAGHDYLNGGEDADTLSGGYGNDTLNGNAGTDMLIGLSGADVLNGGNGADVLEGGVGDDALNGGAGNDLLVGGAGDDLLTGGNGLDTFVFAGSFGHDTITDFSARNLEDIDLSHIAAITDFHDLVSHHLNPGPVADSVVIDDGAGNTIVLLGFTTDDFGAGQPISGADFFFG